ncbi:STAS/SEC14 domain-containing protein [Pontibacter sp. Tf4]|uniref:STAS/SEC14 domain-containing protein n=1 Tax=Pontibacter sp. Tf4 TaxID=2761620 RepID=UPI0016278AD0|nr:STAS/SEC14 domain-containing protein [Pontibacter sp. Tf4]MBB6612689.1 STAS/SEC14 domain-containing protein [Pontibacter sp. Tf4]
MKQELINPFGRVYLTIEEDTTNKWIHVNWMGHLTEDNIKNGARAYTDVLARSGYRCILNDTRLILGSWGHSIDWVLHKWAPDAAKAGLQYFAMITTPETFGSSTASEFYDKIKEFTVAVFEERREAEDWLRQHSLPKLQESE